MGHETHYPAWAITTKQLSENNFNNVGTYYNLTFANVQILCPKMEAVGCILTVIYIIKSVPRNDNLMSDNSFIYTFIYDIIGKYLGWLYVKKIWKSLADNCCNVEYVKNVKSSSLQSFERLR